MDINKVIDEAVTQLPQPLWESWYIKEKIGSGSFSGVYRVEAERAKRVDTAALKIEPIIPDERLALNDERCAFFLKQKKADIEEETSIMYKLKGCPNVVSYEEEDIKEFLRDGKLAGYIFLIRMELLQNVYGLMNSRQLNTDEANIIRLAKEIGNGLKAAHDIGVIHRDVKPSNFFISENGTYKLGDFNIAKQTSYTRSFAGTEGYIAPEVYSARSGNASAYSAQADIYSLGICLYQLMNKGLFPFEDTENTETAIDRRMNGEQLPPPKNASADFSQIILKACAFAPEDRYANMSEMLADLDKLNAQKVDAYVSGAGFAMKKATATVYAGNTSYSAGNETKYADSSVYMQSQAAEASRSSRKKTIITVSAIIALIAVLGGLLFFAAKSLNDKSSDKESSTSAIEAVVSVETTTISSIQTAAATTETTTTTTTKDPNEFVGIINTESDDLSVRAAPSFDSEILGTIPKGTEIKAYYLDDNKDWFKVEYEEKGLSGYSCSHYIINKDKPDEVVPHDWLEATYTSPKKCSVCGATEGVPLTVPDQNEYSFNYDYTLFDGTTSVPIYGKFSLKNVVYADIDSDGIEEAIAEYSGEYSGEGFSMLQGYNVFLQDQIRIYDNGELVESYTNKMSMSGSDYYGLMEDKNTGEKFIGYCHIPRNAGEFQLSELYPDKSTLLYFDEKSYSHPMSEEINNKYTVLVGEGFKTYLSY